jgi:hypothetical protein
MMSPSENARDNPIASQAVIFPATLRVQTLCKLVETQCIETIIKIHKACNTVEGLKYPDTLQLQILTLGRSVGYLATEDHEASSKTGLLAVFERILGKSTSTLKIVCESIPAAGSLNEWTKVIEANEVKVYDAAVPVLDFLKAYKWCVMNFLLDNLLIP